jgi:DNA-binding transcriptional regulator YiaG
MRRWVRNLKASSVVYKTPLSMPRASWPSLTWVPRPRPVDMQSLSQTVGIMRNSFPTCLGFSSAKLQHPDRGDLRPEVPALPPMNVIERHPDALTSALHWQNIMGDAPAKLIST